MNTHYRDIKLFCDGEIAPSLLFNELFDRFHLGLVNFGVGKIAVSFPEMGDQSFGTMLRLHGAETDLRTFGSSWLRSMKRRVRLGPVRRAPEDAPHKGYRRIRPGPRGPAWARRYARRNNMDVKDVEIHPAKPIPGPFITLPSRSTGGRVTLQVGLGELRADQAPNSYGLGSLVPIFGP